MTKEMEEWDASFIQYLASINIKYADYFNSADARYDSIEKCFVILNGANLRYITGSLRNDIFQEVVEKHKELWGKWHHFAEISS